MVIRIPKGQSLIELVLAIGLAAVILPALALAIVTSREGKAQQLQRLQATELIREMVNATRSVRERGWNSFAVNGTYHPVASSGAWVLSTGSEVVNGYTRQITIADVYRDSTGGAILSSSASGYLDPSTKKITASISWPLPYASSINSVFYLTRYLESASYTNTLYADFIPGIIANTMVASASGGEVQLSNNNKAKWCSPAFSSSSIDLPDGPPVSVDAKANATSSAIPNDVFVATAPYASSSVKLAHVQVTANNDPPVSSLHGIFTLDSSKYSNIGLLPSGIGIDNSFKTNSVKYYKSPAGKVYALMATDLSDHEVIAVQVNDGVNDTYQDPTNKIYKYWTYFNTKIYGAAYNNPTANAAETTNAGDNNGYGTSPTNAYLNDGSFAVDSNSGTNTGTNCDGTDKDKHRYYNYGFSVPSGATINGIEISLVAKTDNTTGTPKICIELSWDGGTSWTAAKTTAGLTTSSATYTLGGSADTWGRTWSDANFSNANFRVRVINIASNTSRDFSLDWVGAKVYYNGISSVANDQAPFNYGGKAITVLGNTGYVASGGYLYAFDLSNIDTKSTSSSLDQLGCRIQLDGYDCNPGSGTDKKYAAGETGGTWSDTTSPAHNDCSDGGNTELYADNDLSGVQVGGHNYIYVAVGAGTNPEFEIVDATSTPDSGSSPSITSASCGRISGGNAGWKQVGSLDFNTASNTEEAANSVYAKSDGTRAYISSNGGIDANSDGQPDSKQFYIINTSSKTAPAFLSGTPATGATSGFYYGSTITSGGSTFHNDQLFPRRSLTVLNGQRAVLVGKNGIINANDAQEYQVLDMTTEATPNFCGGLNFDQGFNDLTSVSEADFDNYVYMVANTSLNELKIIQGGPDGIYVDQGTYTSPIFDAGYSTAFNKYSATLSVPTNTTLQLQFAIADPVSGSCTNATYTYTGPDGTTGTYYTATQSALFLNNDGSGYENPARCVRYKAYMSTTDYNATPAINDITIYYSP